MATGYSAGGKTYSLLKSNENDPLALEVLLNQALQRGGGSLGSDGPYYAAIQDGGGGS